MDIDLSKYYVAAQDADKSLKALASEILADLDSGKRHRRQKALDARPRLNAAEKRAKDLRALYHSMARALQTYADIERVIVTNKPPAPLPRASFERLASQQRMEHFRRQGRLID